MGLFLICEFKYLSPLEDEKIQNVASILQKYHNRDITKCVMKIHRAIKYILQHGFI